MAVTITFGAKVDADLGRDVLAAARRARGVALAPAIFGEKARATGAEPFRRLPASVRKTLELAGQRADTLAGLRLADLGAAASQLTLAHVDALHEEALRATYEGFKLPKKAMDLLIRHGMPIWELLDFINPCGRDFVRPDNGVVILPPDIDWDEHVAVDQIVERLRDLVGPYRGVRFPVPPRPPEKEPDWRTDFAAGPQAEDLGAAVDLLGAGPLADLRGAEAGADIARAVRAGPGAMLALAQAMAFRGNKAGALDMVKKLAALDPKADVQRDAYQIRVLAPAVAAAISGPGPASLHAARAALEQAPAGTAAATIAQRSAVRAASSEARRLRSDGRRRGTGRRARKRAAIDAAIGVASARYLDGVAARPAVAFENATALLDLYRSYAAAMSGAVTSPQRVRHGKPIYGKGGKGPTDILRSGPSAFLNDPTLRAHAFDSFLHLHNLCRANVGCGAWDLFRFDFLADEARKLLDDLGRIDALAVELIELLYLAALEGIEATDAFRQQVEEIVQRIVGEVNAAAAKLRDTIAAAVPVLRELGALQAIYDVLKAWPHDNWIAVINAVAGAFSAGTDPAVAARNAIGNRLGNGIAAALGGAKNQITDTLSVVDRQIRSILQPDPAANPNHPLVRLREEIRALFGASGPDPLQPLDEALASISVVEIARPILDELDAANAAGEVPAWLQTVLLLYVAAPFIVAISILSGAIILRLFGVPMAFEGWVAAAVCKFILIAGAQYIIAAVLQLFDGMLSRAGQIQAEVNRLVTRLNAIAGDLVAALAITAMLQSALDAVNALLAALDEAFPVEINSALSDAVLAARTALRSSLATVLEAVEDSFFRETLEIVEVLPDLEEASPPVSGTSYDPNLGYANRLAAALSRFEAERIRRLAEPAQVLTQVISLAQVLPGAALQVLNSLQGLVSKGGNLAFELKFEDLDRVAPGLHRQLIRDVQVHLDFDLDAIPLPPLANAVVPLPGTPTGTLTGAAGEEITRADAIAAIVGENTALAGGISDPALDGAVPGGGFRGLPVIAGRLPTGIPALITHDGISRFRMKDVQSIRDAADRGSRLVAGLTLEPDGDADLANAGWHVLTICEPPQQQLLSHFRVLEDGIRFFDPEKEINPFEFRSLAGSWTIEIPAVKLGHIEPQLPPIRDVRLIVSTVARYDSSLASGIKLPALPASSVLEPDPRDNDDLKDLLVNPLAALQTTLANVAALISDLLGVVGQLPALVEGLQGQLASLIGQVESLAGIAGGTTQAVADLRDALDQALADATTQLADKITSLETAVDAGFTSLSGDLGELGTKLDEIADISATTAGLLAQSGDATGVAARQLRVLTLSTDDLGNEAGVLAGSATGAWTIDAAMLAARGITGPATIAWVVVTAVTSDGSLLGGVLPGGTAPAFPSTPATLTFTPAGGGTAQTASLLFDSPTATLDGADLGGGTAASSPLGAWSLRLPAGMPTLTEALLAIFVEANS